MGSTDFVCLPTAAHFSFSDIMLFPTQGNVSYGTLSVLGITSVILRATCRGSRPPPGFLYVLTTFSLSTLIDDHFLAAIPTEPGGINHTPAFTASAKTIVAHEETLVTVKALALTGFRVIDDDDWFAKVRAYETHTRMPG